MAEAEISLSAARCGAGSGCETGGPEMAKKPKPVAAAADVQEGLEEDEVEMKDIEPAWSMSVPEAGRKYFGLGKKASYDNAGPPGSGALIPTLKAGRLLKAMPRLIEKRLAGETP